jgi:predicted porin
MKNHLIALAASALVAGMAIPAQAQSSVTLSGLVDVYAGSMRMAGDGGRTAVIGSGGLTTSWWGVQGTEDLGGGLKASFLLNSFMRSDSGVPGRFNGDPYFARDANVSLAGSLGSLRVGRGTAPNFVPTILANPFGDSFTFSPLVLHGNVNTANWRYGTTPSDTGWSNGLAYTTPRFGGLSFTLQYQFGEQGSNTGNDSKKNVGINFIYINGPWSAVGFYERDQISNPVAPGLLTTTVGAIAIPETKNDWMLGGAYDFTFAKLFLTYGGAKTDIADYDARTASVGVKIPLGSGAILGGLARTRVTGTYDGTRTTGTVGYDYYLSKRTDLYAMAMQDRVTNRSSGASYALGMRHRF